MIRESRGSGVWRTDDPLPDWYYGPVSDFIGPSVLGVPTDVLLPILLLSLAAVWVAWVTLKVSGRKVE